MDSQNQDTIEEIALAPKGQNLGSNFKRLNLILKILGYLRNSFFFFFPHLKFILRQRETERCRGGRAERGRARIPGRLHAAIPEPVWGSNPHTVRSRPELKPRVRHLTYWTIQVDLFEKFLKIHFFVGAPGWLSLLSTWLRLRSWSSAFFGLKCCIGLSVVSAKPALSHLSLPLPHSSALSKIKLTF